MDEFPVIVLIVLFVLFAPWMVVWFTSRRRKRQREEDQQRWRQLQEQVRGLELAVSRLQRGSQPLPAQSSPRDAAVVAAPAVPKPDTSGGLAPLRESAPPAASPPPIPAPPAPAVYTVRAAAPAAPAPETASAEPAAGVHLAAASGLSLPERGLGGLDLEEKLGANWFNKLGIVLVVFGVAFFLAWALQAVGPAGKVLVGYLAAAALLGGGIFLEHRARYRVFARGGIGGGWALIFFTTYAMYHVPAARVLTSQVVDLVLMLIAAAAMVFHSLRYRSQVVTGLAFLLAFSTVTVSQVTVYSLTANAVLVLALVAVVVSMRWFELEVFGLLAVYLNHWLWLRHLIEPMHGSKHPFPEFLPSAAFLLGYWLAFRVSYLWRKDLDRGQERVSSIAALLNSFLLLGVLKYQSVHPEWTFWALLAIGVAEFLLAQLPRRRRRTAFIILTTIAVALLVAAIPFRYSGGRLAVLWLLESEALLLAGVLTRESVFRRLGVIASALVPAQLLAYDAARIYGMRLDDANLSRHLVSALVMALTALVLYFNAHYVAVQWRELFPHPIERTVLARLSFAAGVMLFVAAWAAFPEAETVVAWALLALALSYLGWRFGRTVLAAQASLLFLAALLRGLSMNLHATATWGHLTQRLVTLAVLSAALYAAVHWIRPLGAESWGLARRLPAAYQWVASGLVVLLAWYELRPVGVALVWAIFGVIMLEIGLAQRNRVTCWQGYGALGLAFTRIFFVNLNAAGAPGSISPRFYTIVPLALIFFYVYGRLTGLDSGTWKPDEENRAGELAAWAGTIALASLMRFEVDSDWVVTAWAALACALVALAWATGRMVFLRQAVVGAFAVLFRGVLHNLYERSYLPAPPWHGRAVCLGSAAALSLLALVFAFRLPQAGSGGESASPWRRAWNAAMRHPEQVFFFVPLLTIILLMAVELRRGMITVGWSLLGVAVFLFALWVGKRSFRLAGLGLLLLGVGKIVVADVWSLNLRDRCIAFLALGSALVLVSFLYSRYREAIRQYL
jgi:hypothetical protein